MSINRCQRGTVKTGKKDCVKLNCCHEEIVRIFSGVRDNFTKKEALCANGNIKFDCNTGGKCKHCKDSVLYCTAVCQESHWPKHQQDCSKTMAYLDNSAKFMLDQVELPVKEEILKDIKHRNALETLGKQGWPRDYYTNEEYCPLCKMLLSTEVRKKQRDTENDSFLLTKDHCIPVIILSRKCRSCLLIVQASTLDLGLINLGDTLLLSLELMYSMQHLIRRGLPPLTAAKAVVEEISERTDLGCIGNIDYLETRIMDAFYAFESLTRRPASTLLCGICGIIPDVLLGDGNEDVSCKMSDANWDITSRDSSGETISKEEASTFFESLRCHFIKYLLLPSVAREVKFVLKMNQVPPVVNSLAAGEVLYNSEHVKDSKLMKNRDKLFGNQEMLMHLLKTGEIILGELDSYSNEDLLKLCHKLKFENLSSLPSAAMKKLEIWKLYQSIVTGTSQCHFTGNEKHSSGGWYTFVCPHGLIYASRLLFLKESVRDAGDLWLSLRYRPPVTISDTACTFTSNLLLREPERSVIWFQDKKGCFEVPKLGKNPEVKSVSVLEKKEVQTEPCLLGPEVHPRAGVADKFVVEDRFHGANNPHKNELCCFHSANNCSQLSCLATSQQEQLNSIKNNLRLRSTCTQRPERHFMYNIIMDEYHNESLVKKQESQHGKHRDHNYHYFCAK